MVGQLAGGGDEGTNHIFFCFAQCYLIGQLVKIAQGVAAFAVKPAHRQAQPGNRLGYRAHLARGAQGGQV